ncbi:glycosyltransferase [Sciscionella sediminilitoris]|uniref:glycosyltransferase n=1 Tax=Sciscionella sediminilitoris TaxID=1445613 RepID=UPI0009E721DA|nr:glycosyltransferase [Sciscionella sp. SE31]
MTAGVQAIAVIVPAHDEAASIEACVDSVLVAGTRLPTTLDFAVIVVADTCTDETPWRATRAGAHTHTVQWRNVGRSRAAGADEALRHFGIAGLWIACTDADTVVPRDWLTSQLRAAVCGWDAFAGTVRLAAGLRHAFDARYRPRQGHRHAHGANLGVRAVAYTRVGGFPPLATGEDAGLLARLRAHRFPVLATAEAPVRTSARLNGRAPRGFAHDLRMLNDTTGSVSQRRFEAGADGPSAGEHRRVPAANN